MSQSTSPNARLSVAMIVRDGGQALARTLQSVAAIADQIVVLDTGSRDDSVQIARRHGAEVFEQPWQDDFAAARNACLEHVTGDWVLWLDAGERLTEEMARQLRHHVDHVADPTKAYLMLVKVPPAPNSVAGEQAARIRLVPNLHGLRFVGRLRETLAPSLAENHIELEGVPISIWRDEGEHDTKRKTKRARRNLQIAELQLSEQPESAAAWLAKAEALFDLDKTEEAKQCYRRVIDAAEDRSLELLEGYYGLLTALEDGKHQAEQLSLCLKALEHFPLDAQLLCAMGSYLQTMGRLDLALRSYQTAFQYGQIHPETWHLQEMRQIVAVCYSLTQQLAGDDDGAQQVLQQALESAPDSVRLRRQLIDLHVKRGQLDAALAQLTRLPLKDEQRTAMDHAIRGACLAAQQQWEPARKHLVQAHDQGCREILCLRWLSITLVALGRHDEARTVLIEWQQRDPANRQIGQLLGQVSKGETAQAPTGRFHRVDAPGQAHGTTAAPAPTDVMQQVRR